MVSMRIFSVLPIGLFAYVVAANAARVGDDAAEPARVTSMLCISDYIVKIRTEKSKTLRTQYAEELSDSIGKGEQKNITDTDINMLADMMADKDDSVRYWIAISLGLIGPRAKHALPQLEKAYKEKVCVIASKTSASAIRPAISRIGGRTPSITCN